MAEKRRRQARRAVGVERDLRRKERERERERGREVREEKNDQGKKKDVCLAGVS